MFSFESFLSKAYYFENLKIVGKLRKEFYIGGCA